LRYLTCIPFALQQGCTAFQHRLTIIDINSKKIYRKHRRLKWPTQNANQAHGTNLIQSKGGLHTDHTMQTGRKRKICAIEVRESIATRLTSSSNGSAIKTMELAVRILRI